MNLYLHHDVYNFGSIKLIYPNKNEDVYKLFNINIYNLASDEIVQEVTKALIEKFNSIEEVNEKFVIDSILNVDFTTESKTCLSALIDEFISKSKFKKYKGLLKWVPMLQDRFWLNEIKTKEIISPRRSKKSGKEKRSWLDLVKEDAQQRADKLIAKHDELYVVPRYQRKAGKVTFAPKPVAEPTSEGARRSGYIEPGPGLLNVINSYNTASTAVTYTTVSGTDYYNYLNQMQNEMWESINKPQE